MHSIESLWRMMDLDLWLQKGTEDHSCHDRNIFHRKGRRQFTNETIEEGLVDTETLEFTPLSKEKDTSIVVVFDSNT